MKSLIFFVLSEFILFPVIVGLVRWRRIDKSYQPFFFLLCVGAINEVVSFILIKEFHLYNYVPMNMYIVVEWIMLAWQFHVWGFLKHKRRLFYVLLFLSALFWVAENFVFGTLSGFSPYFRFFYFFLVVLLSINQINFMITHDNRSLFRNPRFLICIGFVIYFVFMTLFFWAYQVSLYDKSKMSTTFVYLMAYVNALTNSIYAIAFLLIPARVKFTL
jgi:hypothetical protein